MAEAGETAVFLPHCFFSLLTSWRATVWAQAAFVSLQMTGSNLWGSSGVTGTEAPTHGQGSASKRLDRRPQWEPPNGFQGGTPWSPQPGLSFQSSETAVLATQVLILLARVLTQNYLPWHPGLQPPSHCSPATPACPALPSSPTPTASWVSEPHKGKAHLTSSLGSSQFLSGWPHSKEFNLILPDKSTLSPLPEPCALLRSC
jgi:hypothetical protein